MIKCPRCGGPFRLILAFPSVLGFSCFTCGNYVDPVILQNRGEGWRHFWRKRTNQEDGEITRAEKICREYEEEAIRLNI